MYKVACHLFRLWLSKYINNFQYFNTFRISCKQNIACKLYEENLSAKSEKFCSFTSEKYVNKLNTLKRMQVKIVNKSAYPLPEYATEGSAGMDLRANIETAKTLQPMERAIIPTGLYIELPIGYEAQVRPRSGMAFKKGLSIPNSPGTIDADYRGEIGVIVINLNTEPIVIEPGERVAQMVIAKYERISWSAVDSLSETDRGAGGFGSTGKI